MTGYLRYFLVVIFTCEDWDYCGVFFEIDEVENKGGVE
jgi:hypothetical protein